MSKYGYAGKKLDEKLKMEAIQKRLEQEQQETNSFLIQLIFGGCFMGLAIIIIPHIILALF